MGNPLTVEDSFGLRVLQKIRLAADQPNIDLLDAHTDLLGYIDRFASYPLVVIVDALLDPNGILCSPGEVSTLEEVALLSLPDDSPSIHQISPVVALKLFRKLHPEATTRIFLVAYCTRAVGYSGILDEAVVAQAASQVLRLVQ